MSITAQQALDIAKEERSKILQELNRIRDETRKYESLLKPKTAALPAENEQNQSESKNEPKKESKKERADPFPELADSDSDSL